MAAIRFHPDFLLWGHREQDAPDNKNNMHDTDSKVRQELYQSTQYEKPRQDVGVFYCQILVFHMLS